MRPVYDSHDARDARETFSDTAISRSRKTVAYLLLLVVCGSVAAMSWAGLFGFARQTLHWSSWHAALVPIALDVAALSCALLALDSLARNDAATSFRVLTAVFVGLSAFLNWRHALGTHSIAEQVFFPAMSCLGYLFIDSVLRKFRRDARRDRMGLPARPAPAPLPNHGMAAWARFPRRAFAATSNAIAQRIDDTAPDASGRGGDITTRQRDYAAGVLVGLRQSDAIRRGLDALGYDAPTGEVVAWLEANGLPGVAPQRVSDVKRRQRDREARESGGKHRAPEQPTGPIYAITGGNDGGEIAS